MITWPILVALILATIAVFFKVKSEQKAIDKEKKEIEKDQSDRSENEEKNG